jgi:hypothetical protein
MISPAVEPMHSGRTLEDGRRIARVVINGAGVVGSTTAYALLISGATSE